MPNMVADIYAVCMQYVCSMYALYMPNMVADNVTEHAKRAQLAFKIILSFSAKLRLRSILGKTFLAAIQYQIKVLFNTHAYATK